MNTIQNLNQKQITYLTIGMYEIEAFEILVSYKVVEAPFKRTLSLSL